MRLLRGTLACLALGFCAVARAVYAPIPEQQQGRDLTLSVEAGVTYNNNIFGAASDAISSYVYEVSPKIAFNSSVSETTFVSGDFHPTLDYFDNRPGTKTVYSQAIDGRIAHSFSSTSVIDLTDSYSYNQNPEAILNGAPINTDQTLQSDEFDGRFTFAPTEKLGIVLKTRIVDYDYTNKVLGDLLNRFENLYGLEFDYTLLHELKAAGEYRHLRTSTTARTPPTTSKHSDFFMAGFDYNVGPKLSASVRVGAEYRHREDLPDETTPYVEISGKYDYAKRSFVSLGYTYSLEETSNPLLFSDEKRTRAG